MDSLSILAGLVLLFLGGEGLVRGSVAIAARMGLSTLLVSMVVVGFGTSAPELIVSTTAALEGLPNIALGNVVGSNLANATPVTWTLNDVAFADLGTATGSFVFDADTNIVNSWSISVAGGDSTTFPAFTYEPVGNQFAGAFSGPPDGQYFSFNDPPTLGSNRLIRIDPSELLTNSGGTVDLVLTDTNFAVECFDCSPSRAIISGSISAVPLPAAFPLFAAGLIALVGIARGRQTA